MLMEGGAKATVSHSYGSFWAIQGAFSLDPSESAARWTDPLHFPSSSVLHQDATCHAAEP